jgi:hypothetical protein
MRYRLWNHVVDALGYQRFEGDAAVIFRVKLANLFDISIEIILKLNVSFCCCTHNLLYKFLKYSA